MKATTENQRTTTVAAAAAAATRIAGEEISADDFVTILSKVIELPSFLRNFSDVSLPPDEPVRTCYLPRAAGVPSKVITVCLPFVCVQDPSGYLFAFDTRLHELVRLDRASAKPLWKQMREPFRNKRNRK